MRLIRFVPDIDDKELMLLEPTPAKEHVPDWYRKGESAVDMGPGKDQHSGMKSCAPFLDVMLTGYCLVTPFDIYVGKNEDGSQNVRWNGPPEWSKFIEERPTSLGATIPRPAGYGPNGLVWSSKWGWKTPRGWSTLVCHPLNHHELPFFTLSGTIESDKFIACGNIPFFLQKDWFGVIPAGTPIAQIIPFKRKSWKKVADYGLFRVAKKQGEQVRLQDKSYKKTLWVRKDYN